MAKIQTGLGRGLGALISDANYLQQNKKTRSEQTESSPLVSIADIDIEKIVPNPYQPRTEFNLEAIEELSQSIKLLGLIQPITVRPIGEGQYQIISGERRYHASKLAGIKTIPAYIRETDDNGMLEMAIVENIQREDLDAIEVAVSFQRLIDECNLTQEAMADRVGKKRATVTNYLRLLKLPAEIQFAIRAKKITMGHAKSLLGIENPKIQLKLANQIIEQDLSVRQVETKVQNLNKEKKAKKEKEVIELPENYFKVIDTLGKYFNNNISVKRSDKGAGELVIRFSSDKEMDDFLSALENSGL
ncbi:MAG: ParB/RepB/Spo0J family partition protein [Bacteroidales bacterium]|nr:ParB/RepB/Spo0J family partition protein [Bacteroidales bacterium]